MKQSLPFVSHLRPCLLAAASIAAVLSLGMPSLTRAADKPLDKQAVEQIVRDYLIKNPEVLVEAMQALEAKEKVQADEAQKTALTANREALENQGPVGGNPKGDVTLVEFFDYNCGYCKHTHPERVEAVKKDGKVRVVYKEFPILAPSSMEAAKAALAANRQGKYEAFHSALMKHEGRLDSDVIRQTAKDVGLDIKKLEADMGDPTIQKEIDGNIALARELGIRGTPGFVVGDTLVPGAIDAEQFTDYFRAARAAKTAGKAG
jgi:protein-disulfide isomerase